MLGSGCWEPGHFPQELSSTQPDMAKSGRSGLLGRTIAFHEGSRGFNFPTRINSKSSKIWTCCLQYRTKSHYLTQSHIGGGELAQLVRVWGM